MNKLSVLSTTDCILLRKFAVLLRSCILCIYKQTSRCPVSFMGAGLWLGLRVSLSPLATTGAATDSIESALELHGGKGQSTHSALAMCSGLLGLQKWRQNEYSHHCRPAGCSGCDDRAELSLVNHAGCQYTIHIWLPPRLLLLLLRLCAYRDMTQVIGRCVLARLPSN